ncbi:MAG: DUF2059 domain-containing protein [Thiohalomonadales bacterium]
MRKIIFYLLFFISMSSFANERTEKIATLMKTQGLLEMWQQQLDMGKIAGEKQAKEMIDQILIQINPDKKLKESFEIAFTKFISKIQGNWIAQEIVEVWAKFYGAKFSDSELDKLISFYTSEIGQKDIQASKLALVEFSKYFQDKSKPIMDNALKEYVSELKIAVKECKCPKNK